MGGAAYVSGGVNYNKKVHGTETLPHRAFWAELGALVVDGISFARRRGKTGPLRSFSATATNTTADEKR